MASSGVRFDIQLDASEREASAVHGVGLGGLLGDIKERTPAQGRPPSPPRLKVSKDGFPAHKPRAARAPKSAARTTKQSYHKGDEAPPDTSEVTSQASTQTSIDRENSDRLAAMTEQEILNEKRELESNLSPSIRAMLLRRGRSGKVQQEPVTIEEDQDAEHRAPAERDKKPGNKQPSSEGSREQVLSSNEASSSGRSMPDLSPSTHNQPNVPDFHFPEPPGPPDLDPNDPAFQQKLHDLYFPSLPSDPSSLSWMAPPRAEESAAYSPQSETLAASSLRFDFRGQLLPPRLSSQIPTTKGLHHHGHAPERAGYTIPELSHLARSVVASQQCIAFQTLGRILFRLGKGEFGWEGAALHDGMWELINKGKALDSMIEIASHGEGGNRSVWATATDAVWLFRKGGGVKWRGR